MTTWKKLIRAQMERLGESWAGPLVRKAWIYVSEARTHRTGPAAPPPRGNAISQEGALRIPSHLTFPACAAGPSKLWKLFRMEPKGNEFLPLYCSDATWRELY